MISKIVRNSLWAVLAAAYIHEASAMDPDRLMTQYVRERWGSDRGLQGEVHAITQTGDGYLWIGTEKGLFRFDGWAGPVQVERMQAVLQRAGVNPLTEQERFLVLSYLKAHATDPTRASAPPPSAAPGASP